MAFELNSLRTDTKKEQDGVWIDYLDGSKLLIARMGNAKYKGFIANEYRANKLAIDRGGRSSEDLAVKIQNKALATHILLDWEGIIFDGEEKKYTPEFGLEVFEKLPDFKADVENFAGDVSFFSAQADKEVAEDLTKSA